MELRGGAAGADQALREPGDDVVVLGVDHHHRALAPRRREHVEDLTVIELERVVGHVNLERRIAVLDQRRQLLAEHPLGRVRDDQVKGVIDHRLAPGARVVVLDHGAERLAPVLRREGDDAGGAAAGRRDGARAEVVRRGGAHRGGLVDVAVAVDPARQHELARRVDLVRAGPKPFRQGDDAAVADAHVARHRVGGRGHRAAANDEIVVGLSHCALRLQVRDDFVGEQAHGAPPATPRRPSRGRSRSGCRTHRPLRERPRASRSRCGGCRPQPSRPACIRS